MTTNPRILPTENREGSRTATITTWVDSWSGIGRIFVGMAPRLRPPTHAIRREGLARDVLHDRDGALADEREGHRVGAHAVARD